MAKDWHGNRGGKPNGKPSGVRQKSGSAPPRGSTVVSGGTRHDRFMVGDRLVSGNAANPRPSSVTAEDYADYTRNVGSRPSGGSRPAGRKSGLARNKRGRNKTGFESARQGSTVREVVRKYLPRLRVRLIASAMAAIVVGVLASQIYMSLYVRYTTQLVTVSPHLETIDVEGVAIREEILLEGKLSNTSVKAVQNGDKVCKGEAIINIYSSTGEAAAYERLAQIDNELDVLNSMITASEDSANAVDSISRQLDSRMADLNTCAEQRNLNDIAKLKSDISYLLNKRLVVMRQVEDYDARIKQLKQESESLRQKYSRQPKTVNAPESGYFVDTCDGYEKLLTPSGIDSLTVEKLDKIMNGKVSAPEKVVGKLVGSFSWYLACPVSAIDGDFLTEEATYTLYLPYSRTEKIKAVLHRLNKVEGEDQYLAIFRCSTLVSELCTVRTQPVKIQKCLYEGYTIKKSALHAGVRDVVHKNNHPDDDFPRGHLVYVTRTTYPSVYAIVAGQVREKEVDIVYGTDKIVICSPKHDGGDYLSLYDEVVLEERGLYDGKIVR